MIRLLKFAWSYYKLYKYVAKEKRMKDELALLNGKINALKLAITQGYTNETEFAERISSLSRVYTIDKLQEFKEKSFERSRKISSKVAEAVANYEKGNL